MRWYQWTMVAVGAWLLVSPWTLGFSELNLPAWNSVIAGALVIVFALWTANPQH